jgi:predicted nucleic acid-binding protein
LAFVLDASVTVAWCFEDEASEYTESVLDLLRGTEAVVPTIWTLEVANALLVAERRGRLSDAEATRFLEVLDNLSVRVDAGSGPAGIARVLPIARSYGLSAYDAAYLELAMRLGLSLATLDEALKRASTAADVPLI